MEEEKKEQQEIKVNDKVKEEVDKSIKRIMEQGVQTNNIDFLYKMIDVKKDIAEIEKEEKESMYGNYYGEYNEGGNYGRRGVPGSGRGRYRDGGSESSYGRRGVRGTGRGRYRGEEMMEEMSYHYGNYNEGREQYGADQETMKSFKYMLKSFKDYYRHLKDEASSQQEVKMLEDVAREISEM
jgi:hypothetical protein